MLLGAIFLGANKLPELARSFGKAQSEFEKVRVETMRLHLRNNNDYSKVDINRQKLEEAARIVGIENAANLSDEELKYHYQTIRIIQSLSQHT
jgi:sec-independent protein translocase protein TatA